MGQDLTKPCCPSGSLTEDCCGPGADDALRNNPEQLFDVSLSPGHFIVTLDKTAPGSKLGLDVDNKQSGYAITIRGVTGGLAQKWNNDHPSQKMTAGMKIVEVNGYKGDVKGMMDRCKSDKILKLEVAPAEGAPYSHASSPSPAGAPPADTGSKPPLAADAKKGREAGHKQAASAGSAGGSSSHTGGGGRGADHMAANSPANQATRGGVDQNALASLTAMGFPQPQVLAALQANGNDVEQALTMLTSGSSNAPDPGGGGRGRGGRSPEVQTLMDMGFTQEQAQNAMDAYPNNVERAAQYLLGS